MRIKIGQTFGITATPFLGAGWSWPYFVCGKWHIYLYFHCKRGLCLGMGWSEVERRLRKRIRELSPEERAELFAITRGQSVEPEVK